MLTARAATSPIVISETIDCTSISILTRTVSGIASVGLNAVALVTVAARLPRTSDNSRLGHDRRLAQARGGDGLLPRLEGFDGGEAAEDAEHNRPEREPWQ
jgi:hypothetical protein